MARKFGFSWSWKRASGLSGLKQRISRNIGIPLTKGGRQRKVGRLLGGFGLLLLLPFFGRRATSPQSDGTDPGTDAGSGGCGCCGCSLVLLVLAVGGMVLSIPSGQWEAKVPNVPPTISPTTKDASPNLTDPPSGTTLAKPNEQTVRQEPEKTVPQLTDPPLGPGATPAKPHEETVSRQEPEKRISQFREFRSADGGFSVSARYIGIEDNDMTVMLRREDNGKLIRVPMDRLSEADQDWIAKKRKSK